MDINELNETKLLNMAAKSPIVKQWLSLHRQHDALSLEKTLIGMVVSLVEINEKLNNDLIKAIEQSPVQIKFD